MPKYIIPTIQSLLDQIIAGNFKELESDGRSGRLSALGIEKAIINYGNKLVPIPLKVLESTEVIRVDSSDELWAVDIDLWTDEQGKSDLTLSLWVRIANGEITSEILDVHVM